MPRPAPGPYRTIQPLDGSAEVPYYIIPFDKRGRCEAPLTREHLVSAVRNGDFSDVFLFSHGWNNDWTVATKRYESFMTGYMDMRREHGLAAPAGYRPLLVGVFWPSTALVLTEEERGPRMAAGTPEAFDTLVAEDREALHELAEDVAPEHVEELYTLAQKPTLSADEAQRLGTLLRPLYATGPGEESVSAPAVDEIVAAWSELGEGAVEPDLGDFGTAGRGVAGGPQTAGVGDLFAKIDPRQVVRAMTVWKMKSRAGTVGARGVQPLLRELLEAGTARLHLIGHSYGGKVMLSAIGNGPDLPRPVESLLLLQPAVSHLCFAENVPGTDRAGGYRQVLGRVRRPILSTFSKHDFPLTKTFHLALRRKSDLGEAQIAGAGEPPSKYAALGGYGPRGAREKLIDIRDAGQRYELADDVEIYGLRGDRTISGHGDISNPSTWWALYNLVS